MSPSAERPGVQTLKGSTAKYKLTLILLLYLVLTVAYSVVVPIGRGADEWAHYWYAQFISQNGRLPATPAEREAAGYKSDWPPLYHLFAAGVTGWVETDGPPTFKYRADSIRRQLVPAQGSDAIIHTEDERFPWQQEILVWHLGRFLSIIFSTGTLIVTYFIALEVFAGNTQIANGQIANHTSQITQHATRNTHSQTQNSEPGTLNSYPKSQIPNPKSKIVNPQSLALVSVALLAFSPRFLFTGMLFNYDSLTLLLSSVFLWLAIRIAKGRCLRWGFFGLGALAGLALVTKYLAALLPLVILYLAWLVVQQNGEAINQKSKGTAVKHPSSVLRPLSFTSRRFWRYIGQAALAFIFVISWWFAYLLINFNEIDTYGPVLGTLAPLIRGDGSDRTVEQLFAVLSGGQAPPPAYIEQQTYTARQIVTSFFTTFWGNPVTTPYPLNWLIVVMAIVTLVAVVGVILTWRRLAPRSQARQLVSLLGVYCLLPVPFMVIRLFGARDALEAVQGRHILFLAAPAVAVLLVVGIREIVARITGSKVAGSTGSEFRVQNSELETTRHATRNTQYVLRFTFYGLITLLLFGAIAQLVFMNRAYPPLSPVSTVPYQTKNPSPQSIQLEGGAELLNFSVSSKNEQAVRVDMIWQAGTTFAPEDYQIELVLVDPHGEAVSHWQAYQTQARYPTRVWEPGDVIRDTGWLPLVDIPAGEYNVQLRIIGKDGSPTNWHDLGTFAVTGTLPVDGVVVWQQGEQSQSLPVFNERETILLTTSGSAAAKPQLTGPNGAAYAPIASGSNWVNFIVEPDWTAGDYTLEGGEPFLRVAKNEREFQTPASTNPLDVNFDGKIRLLGYDLPSRRVEPGQGLPIVLYWQGLDWMGEEFVIFNRLLDNQAFAWGGYDRMAKENYSTLLWAPGEIVVDGFAVPVDPTTPNGVYTLNLGWYQKIGGQAESLPVIDSETGEPTGQTAVTIGSVKIGGPPNGATVQNATPQVVVNQSLGDVIELLGYDFALDDTSQVTLTFYWQSLAVPESDYTVFAHVRNTAGETVAQRDRQPLTGAYPTGLWDTGEIIKDELILPLSQLPSGEYEVVVGMYDFNTGARLPVAESPDGTIFLQSIEVNDQ